jgi:hypothetical protein
VALISAERAMGNVRPRSSPVFGSFSAVELVRALSTLLRLRYCFGLAVLVDDEVMIGFFDDSLELGVDVPTRDHETVSLAVDAVVVGDAEREQRLAVGLATLAQHLDRIIAVLA